MKTSSKLIRNRGYYGFCKLAYAPPLYQIARHLASILDGITGLIALPFGRFGTTFNGIMIEKILRWQINKRRSNRMKAQ